ncbi:hypothetical protein CcaverHIS002_0411040 [Cutaneotrichosporon cavernicola]|uniref:Mog1p/PsbP-like protein n=1 Tax=Cutaneotrichosporon cavernicola TaxID=279322 RepID=A0AA48L5G0_9TREE|nr:uncharacterized protein CcaverHIS019_0410950 [Cutaneotrichosporon cavernicola]BEI84500.1 hypothetical protein CcaverHIS002_0411040 [Cutaneotrichosporon cavernicola]BEI92275.1 hypothetical protein CcaverHIS019_0410950 [Cutaneotrichosporon cavernicola]BEJ00047.1 hypothetical protein CcaverHIS631_0410890 [Cutaneotrichosporon cavernicola]BEJ07819.1 hypothetical protein CcaverHIS641_0410880 [Cutaneotrichosporon cavernicola]
MPASLPRPLFGGAISLPVPVSYIDASDLRQIPSNQEVFLSPTDDMSVIVEVLGLVEDGAAKNDLWEAAKFHFASLAHDNAALASHINTPEESIPAPSPTQVSPAELANLPTPKPVLLAGTQTIHKFSHDPRGGPRPGHEADTPDDVFIALALWRINIQVGGKSKRADVVLSLNVPASVGKAERDAAEGWFKAAAGELKIVDWGLFADEP